jgi:hypothetical protein
MTIDFNKVKMAVEAKAEEIPTSNLSPKQTLELHRNVLKKAGRPQKGANYHYTRIAIESEVWHAMKYKKLMGDESFTDQINNAMRPYLGLKKL